MHFYQTQSPSTSLYPVLEEIPQSSGDTEPPLPSVTPGLTQGCLGCKKTQAPGEAAVPDGDTHSARGILRVQTVYSPMVQCKEHKFGVRLI